MTSRHVQSGRVLINYASASTLQQIHGVGEATIALILARRCANDNWTPDAAVRLLTNRHLTPEIILECFDFTKNPMPNMSIGGISVLVGKGRAPQVPQAHPYTLA